VIPREGVERLKAAADSERVDSFVIPREGVESFAVDRVISDRVA